MLWEKELQDKESVYVDVFDVGGEIASSPTHWRETIDWFSKFMGEFGPNELESTGAKSGAAVIALFQIGVDAMRSGETYEKTIKRLNMVLCFAETGCARVGLAYGIRSQYFLKLHEYELCLADIELATKNKCPPEFHHILKANKKMCSRSMGAAGDQKKQPKLSFAPDAKVPCFARGIELKYSKEFGKHVVTNRDLEIGQTVIIEEAYAAASEIDQNYTQCPNCFLRMANFIPCKSCSVVMFCSQKCYDDGHDKFHAMECGKPGVYSHWGAACRLVMATVIKAIKLFPTIEGLMHFVEQVINEQPNIEEKYTDPSIRAYIQFFGLNFGETANKQALFKCAKSVQSAILLDPEYAAKFQSNETKRFLAHLILHHFYVIEAFGCFMVSYVYGPYMTEHERPPEDCLEFAYAQGIYLNSCHLKHSCQPNIARIYMGNKLVCKVLRPIKRGEQLFVSHIKHLELLKTTQIRREFLASNFNVDCKCKSCSSDFPPFKSSAIVKKKDRWIRRALNLFPQDGNTPNNYLTLHHREQLDFEESLISFLKSNEHLHPTKETLLIQTVLIKVWNHLER